MRRDYAIAVRSMLREQGNGRVSIAISGDCMVPHLADAQRVSVQPSRWHWPGDVLVFFSPLHNGLIAHRLIGAFRRSGRWRLLTQADNAPNPDSALEPQQVIGRVVEPGTSPGQRIAAVSRFLSFAWSRLRAV